MRFRQTALASLLAKRNGHLEGTKPSQNRAKTHKRVNKHHPKVDFNVSKTQKSHEQWMFIISRKTFA